MRPVGSGIVESVARDGKGSLVRQLATWGWHAVALPTSIVLAAVEPIVGAVMKSLCALGLIATIVVAGSGAASHFPVVGALAFFAACGAVPVLYRVLLRWLEG